jgi:hypothetical protein
MAKIFISYRRADATDAVGRMFDRLVAAFGEGNIFKDVDSIPLGSDFADVIAERLNDCDAVIVVIGRFWLTVRGQDGTPRLRDPRDYVRIEIEQALDVRAIVVPALVGNVAMPREEQLPESIRRLTRKHAISVRPDPDFHRDMDRLIRGLQEHFNRKDSPSASPLPPPPTDAKRVEEPRHPRKTARPATMRVHDGAPAAKIADRIDLRSNPGERAAPAGSWLWVVWFLLAVVVTGAAGFFLLPLCFYPR